MPILLGASLRRLDGVWGGRRGDGGVRTLCPFAPEARTYKKNYEMGIHFRLDHRDERP